MERIVKAKFITDFYGSAPALGAQEVMKRYVEDKIDKAFLSFIDGIKKKGDTITDKAAEILSVFHRDDNGYPVMGNWMLKKCLVTTGENSFNALKDKSHPKKQIVKNSIIYVEPMPHVNVYNGSIVKQPSGVRTYTVTVGNRSFFKAYEWIPKGTTFEFKVTYDETMLHEEHMELMLQRCGRFGVGAFRERFGKFELL